MLHIYLTVLNKKGAASRIEKMASKIDRARLQQCLDDGKRPTEIAKQIGVSRSAISQAMKAMGRAATAYLAIEQAPRLVNQRLDTIAQLNKINSYANELLELLMAWNRGEDVAIQLLESQMRRVRVHGKEQRVKQIRFKDPRELAFTAMKLIQDQLAFQQQCFKDLYDFQYLQDFQRELIQLLREVNPNAADEFIRRLEKLHLMRRGLKVV
jgi:hypothetical protein